MENFDLGKKIRDLRLKLGISQEDLADLSGLTGRTVQRIEGGQTVPRGDSLKRIAAALQVNIEELTGQTWQPEFGELEDQKILSQEKQRFMEQHYPTHAITPNPRLAALTVISAYAFLIFPLLGLVLPGVIYLLYNKANPLVKKFGKKLLWIESIYCLTLGLVYSYIFAGRLGHSDLTPFMPFKLWLILLGSTYVINAVAITIILINLVRSTKGLWGPETASNSYQ